MARASFAGDLTELENLQPDIAWRLVDTLSGQTSSLIGGASVFMVLGIVGFIGTGSRWYLGGLAYTICIFIWRVWQGRVYARSRDTASPVAWAWRNIRSGWATAAGWGAWSTVVLFEPEKSIVMMMIGMHAGLVAGGAIRNCAVRVLASGQIMLAAIPLFVVCAASGNFYLQVYSGIVAMHVAASFTLTNFLHKQTLELLLGNKEKSDLAGRLEMVNRQLETMVSTDVLTGVANRRAFDLLIAREWQRSAREETPMSILMIDIDHFKDFNDFYGHQAGDACLQEVAATINSAIRRPSDMLARYGGEEFVVILPGTCPEGAAEISKRMLVALANRALPHEASSFGYVTVSIGIAWMIPNSDTTVERLIGLADAALYNAKRSGRNRVHLAETTAQSTQHLISVNAPTNTAIEVVHHPGR